MLGPLEVRDQGRAVPLGGGKQRCLLGVLLLHANQAVSVERLVDELWGEEPSARAAKLVQGYVSGLRKALGADRIVTRAPGYLVRVEPGELDLAEFEQRVEEGRLREALTLWRGPTLADVRFEGFAAREAERVDELRRTALLDRVDDDLRRGRHAELVGELESLVAEQPLQERPRGQLMLALYRSGRQAEALEVYRNTRSLLSDELGLEPGQALQRLERAMLAQDPELELVAPTPEPAPAPPVAAVSAPPGRGEQRVRRTVTLVFADVVASTTLAERLDPEAMHGVLDRYAEACVSALAQHGGTVEKFIGDAVVGVFGLPELHEDDALRAVRAAVQLRDTVAALSDALERDPGVRLGIRIGVNTGEVFAGPGVRREAFATGDAIHVAARLEQAASEGEIFLGEQTYRLVERAARAEPLGPLEVKGRAEPVRAWRLLELPAGELGAPHAPVTPFVGRERELAELEAELRRASADQACRLCTVVGPPGIGKSRLVRELLAGLGDDARVVVGRCLSYGEGITYRPLAEIVRQLGGDEPTAPLLALLAGDEAAGTIVQRVLGAIGLAEPGGRDETFWAVRRLFEAQARERPLVVVIDDVHWAEPTLLELLEYVAGFSGGGPILLLCLARPELLDAQPAWAAPRPNRRLVALDPLPEAEARALVDNLGPERLDDRARRRIVGVAEGNPLFLEQLVAVQAETDAPTLPPSIQAVLAARIDRLDAGLRAVLERAAVEGRSFHRGAVADLLPETERPELGARLLALVREQLIRPDRPEHAGEDAFRFGHVLIREAAYQAVPKRVRAELHERVAGWIAARPSGEDEIVGYHLEQAARYCAELGLAVERRRTLAAAAAERLGAAARKALARGDVPAGTGLLERAVALLPADDPARAALLPRLGAALFEAGRLAEADGVLAEAIASAEARGDSWLEAQALVEQQFVRLQAVSSGDLEGARRVADDSLRTFAEHDDDVGQCRSWSLRAWTFWIEGASASADEAWQRAAAHAGRAGADRELSEILCWRASAALFGPTPVEQGIGLCDDVLELVGAHPVARAVTLHPLAALHAMRGEFETARALIRESNALLDELVLMESAVSHAEAMVELLAGAPAAAEERLRLGVERLEEMGEKTVLGTTAAMLAHAVAAQGRYDEADRLWSESGESAAEEDLSTQVIWRGVRAKILARRGQFEDAEALAREALGLVRRTDWLNHQGDALLDLGEVLRLAGRTVDAEAAVAEAIGLYELKGNVVSAERARAGLAAASAT